MRSLVWMSEGLTQILRERLASDIVVVRSAKEFAEAPRDSKTVMFVDKLAIAELGKTAPPPGPVIAICEEPLTTAIGWLPTHPWLSHVVSLAMLEHPMAKEHLGNVMLTLTTDSKPRLLNWLGPTVTGRRVRLAHSNKRADRLERMSEYFESRGVGSRTVQQLRDATEELLTNAFYDAPVSAGAVREPISRTRDVSLPEESACDMVYGCSEDLAIVRVRDPFGSLSRSRLLEVLTRCARTDMQVEVDESMGGAGLGLWRIFAAVSFVAISVVNNRYTDFLVGIGKRASAGPRPFAFHLFFKEHGRPVRQWQLLDADSNKPAADQSVTIVAK